MSEYEKNEENYSKDVNNYNHDTRVDIFKEL